MIISFGVREFWDSLQENVTPRSIPTLTSLDVYMNDVFSTC